MRALDLLRWARGMQMKEAVGLLTGTPVGATLFVTAGISRPGSGSSS